MGTRSIQPRRQRKAIFTADHFERRRRMAVALSRELRARYGRRQLPPRKGDTVRILNGSYKGKEERVARVDRRSYSVTLDNVTTKTGEAKLKALPIRTSHLLLTRLNLADPWRRRILKVPEGTTAEVEAPTETTSVAPAEETKSASATPTTEVPAAAATTAEETPAAAPRKRKSPAAKKRKEETP
jgi:large subunit ribosomal protein L24